MHLHFFRFHQSLLEEPILTVPLPSGPFFQSNRARLLPSPTLSEEEMWEQIDGNQKQRHADGSQYTFVMYHIHVFIPI